MNTFSNQNYLNHSFTTDRQQRPTNSHAYIPMYSPMRSTSIGFTGLEIYNANYEEVTEMYNQLKKMIATENISIVVIRALLYTYVNSFPRYRGESAIKLYEPTEQVDILNMDVDYRNIQYKQLQPPPGIDVAIFSSYTSIFKKNISIDNENDEINIYLVGNPILKISIRHPDLFKDEDR